MKLAAWILLVGSGIFILGAFLPVSRFYMASTEVKLAIMQEQPVQWLVHLAGMGLGALVAALGLIALTFHLPSGVPATLSRVSVALVAIGTLLWLWHLQLRISHPVEFASRENPIWHFAAYTVLMQVGLLLLAAAFHYAGWPPWMVLVLVGGTLLTILALIVFQDVPPFAHYVWLLVVAIGLVRLAPLLRQPGAAGAVSWPVHL